MECEIKIEVAAATPELTGSNNVLSEIYFVLPGNRYFPGLNWTDFSQSFILYWSMLLLDVLDSNLESGDVSFYDGPYFVRLSDLSNHSVTVSFLERTSKGAEELDAFECNMKQLLDTTLQAMDKLLMATKGMLENSKERREFVIFKDIIRVRLSES